MFSMPDTLSPKFPSKTQSGFSQNKSNEKLKLTSSPAKREKKGARPAKQSEAGWDR
jgi:hypothetical protein